MLSLVVGTALATAAPPPKTKLAPQYDKWLKEDVGYIITDEEKKAFLGLVTDVQRDNFIDDFWAIRNPIRGSAINSYKEEHYKRLQYANDNFGRRSNTPGWMTDMGRAWILFGKPVSQARYLGQGQLYPCELWFYENKVSGPSIPGFFSLLFFMPENIGEFRFYRPSLDTPLKLVRGSQFNSNQDVYNFLKPIAPDLAKAAFTLVPGDPMDTQTFTVDMTSDMMIGRIQNFANDPFNVRKIRELRSLRTNVESKLLVNDDNPLAIDSLVISDPIGQAWLDYSVLVRDVSMGQVQTVPAQAGQPETKQLSVASGFRLLNDKGDLIAQDEEEQAFRAFGADGLFRPFQVAGRLPVMPGSYTLEFRITDHQKSRVYLGEKKFTVGQSGVAGVAGPLFFAAAKQVEKPDGAAPFQYFGAQFDPLAGDEQVRTEPLRVLYALEVPKQTPQEYTIEYLIAHVVDREARKVVKETIQPAAFRDGRLMKSKTIPLTDLPSGSYRVVISVHAGASEAVLASSSMPIRLVDSTVSPALFFLNSARTTAAPAGASYIRALEAIASKDQPNAMRYMKQALDLDIANASAARYLVQNYFETKDYPAIDAIYKKAGIKPFEGSAESLAQISLSFARTGDRKQAKDILDTARALFPENAVLVATAKAVSN
ncbi:MAG TPA: GWxTD domain-containing protein [Bryobacteraceae bacterium]|jgi:GWxTD domain-containing protein|nr:GWxTD domain-containing protein [Bryobacteraceae bacterium]